MKSKITISILIICLIVSVVLNIFLVSKIYKFKNMLLHYKVYTEQLNDQVNSAHQKANDIKDNVRKINPFVNKSK